MGFYVSVFPNKTVMSHLNMLSNPSLDRLSSDHATDLALSRWANLFGLMDVWR